MFRKRTREVSFKKYPWMEKVLKKKGKELSVKKAAQLLNLSERTVLNFIKQKKIQAIKVGRDWFIDYASFISFSEKHEFEISNVSEREDLVSENFGKVPKDSETFRISSESISERYELPNNVQKTQIHDHVVTSNTFTLINKYI